MRGLAARTQRKENIFALGFVARFVALGLKRVLSLSLISVFCGVCKPLMLTEIENLQCMCFKGSLASAMSSIEG